MKNFIFSYFLLICSYTGFTQQYTLIVGTYTQGKSTGIYSYDFNPVSADVILLDSVKSSNPSFIAVDPDNKYVYTVNENGADQGGGGVTAYSFNKKTRKLSFINEQPSMGDHPCYIAVDKQSKFVAVGNYSTGTLAVFPIAPDGGLGASSISLQHQGSGPVKKRQESAHIHATVFSPDNKYLFATDLGIDKVVGYDFNSKTGILKQKNSTKLTAGSGPRHMEFHPSGKWAYVIQELSGSITSFNYEKGSLKQIQEISLLPDGFTGTGSSADVHVSPDGKFLYATNRNPTNTISVFKINQTNGQLSLVTHMPTGGKVPRNFNFDPTGSFLLVANQDSNNIRIFKINNETGLLTDTGKEIKVPNPTCIQWLITGNKKNRK